MIDHAWTRERIILNTPWFESHGARKDGYLGVGLLYFALPYILCARKCVCLGSGGGFVPRLMVEAQRLLKRLGLIQVVDVVLVDAGDGGTSGEHPKWNEQFWQNYPEVKLIRGLTDEVKDQLDSINYLHVDADHSYQHVLSDLQNYGVKMVGKWAITVHDTDQQLPGIESWNAVLDWIDQTRYGVVNFRVGAGTALIMPKEGV